MMKILKLFTIMMLIPSLCFALSSRDFDVTDDIMNHGTAASIDDIFSGGGSIVSHFFLDGWGENNFGRIITKDENYVFTADNSAAFGGNTECVDFTHSFSTAAGQWESDTSSLSLSTWNGFAVTYSRDSTANVPIFYLDGTSITVNEIQAPSGSADSDAAGSFRVGNRTAADRTFDGQIAGTQAYSKILSSVEVNELLWKPCSLGDSVQMCSMYWGGSPELDLSANSNTGAITGATANNNGPPIIFGGALPL